LITNNDGNFAVSNTNTNDSLDIFCMGYLPIKLPLSEVRSFIKLTPSFNNLDEIIISGSRELQKRTEVPVAINIISKSVMNDTRATRLDMLLNKVPGVFMTDLGNEQHSMAVRQPMGTKNLFLYLEDGIPIRTTGDFNHNALIEINQASIERIEVIKGPASSLYGSEAVGGAINFLTQSPSPFLSGKIQAEAGSRGYKRTDFSVSDTYKKTGVFIGGYYANQDQDGNDHNDFSKTAITMRVDHHFNDNLRLSTVADYIAYKTDQKGGIDSTHLYNKDYSSLYRFTYRKVNAFRMRSTLNKTWNEHNKSSATVFYRHSVIGQNPFYAISNYPGNPLLAKGQVNEDAFKSLGTVLQHTTKVKGIKAQVISGISIDFSPASYFAQYAIIDRDASKVYYKSTTTDSLLTNYQVDLLNTAVYSQLEYKPTDRLKIVAAARYDRLDYDFKNHLTPGSFSGAPDNRDQFSHLTPKLGLTYDFGKSKGVYLNYSAGFAPPNITDLYTGVKVPVLQAASYYNYETGGWLSLLKSKLYTEVSLYHMNGINEIVSVRLPDGTYQNQNAGKTSHQGVELNVKYSPVKSINIRLASSFSKHKYIDYILQGKDYSGNTMAQAPPFVYNGEITYKPSYLKGFRVAIELQGMNEYYTNPQNTITYKGFTIFNVRAGYRYKSFELWTNCLNVADQIYAVTVESSAFGTSYRPGQLRSFHVGLAWHFSHDKD
jgi:iron complex outermembrane recepter protein